MKPIHSFAVIPSLPPALKRLRDLAYNLRWAWNHDTIDLFRRLDDHLWETTGHNPVLMLGRIDQARLEAAAGDEAYLAHLERVAQKLDDYRSNVSTWYRRSHPEVEGLLAAYFSAEFGLTESLSIFAGGLGLLAGDHLKSASDLGVPLAGVGLLYQQGYFRQHLNEAGWQLEYAEDNDFYNLPLALQLRSDGNPITVEIDFPGRVVVAQVWQAQVGRLALYLLDTNLPENAPADRDITDQLYGGDQELRIQQEIVLGIGGYQALQALGLQPPVYHMNEGHAAFLALERARRLMETDGVSFAEAREAAAAGLIFTTHTPVPAGHDRFPPELMDRYFGDYARNLGLSPQEFLALGRADPQDQSAPFSMTVLALKMAAHSNGVSRLHGSVSREMFQSIWPGVPEEEVPVGYVTNGVHFRSWISRDLDQLYDRYLSPRWREEPADRDIWQRAKQIPAEELWRTHERRRERLVAFARQRLRAELQRRNAPQSEGEAAEEVLDPAALTLGFARRFATYKRAGLLLRDPERLARLLDDPQRPVQVIFAGKAHPRDNPGKELIQQVLALSRQEAFRRRIVFLEDYDMDVARYLVQGADVWLNTPRRPLEASGTSGMKAMANGALNLSVLDGWWDEAWSFSAGSDEPVGWAIGSGETYTDPAYQDQVEGEALYDLLEHDLIPMFYDRARDGLPRRWIDRMKTSISLLSPYFNTHRMVREYTERFYLPAASHYQRLTQDRLSGARALAAWKEQVEQAWPEVRVVEVNGESPAQLQVGSSIQVQAKVHLGALTPKDVRVELYLGRVDASGEIVGAGVTPMQSTGSDEQGDTLFEASSVPCQESGLHGYTVRVLPSHPDMVTRFLPGLIAWADKP